MDTTTHASWRLYPSETVLWEGGPTGGVPRRAKWRVLPALLFALAVDTACFAGLLAATNTPAVRATLALSIYFAFTAVAALLLPRYLLDACEYVITDRRVLSRRGRHRRSMDRHAITLARVVWHPSVPGVGDLELERSVPFGPLMRKQRLVLHEVRAPDALFALVRDVAPAEHAGDRDVPLSSRLDPGESLVWGGAPERALPDWREVLTAIVGFALIGVSLWYEGNMASALLDLEHVGLAIQSWTWLFFFLSTFVAFAVMASAGGFLAWWGLVRSRALVRDTDYLLTEHRLLIRRGHTELSVDRRRIVDVVDEVGRGGLHTLFLILDAHEGRALADNGALSSVTPPKDGVPPILYELRDAERLRALLMEGKERTSRPSWPPMQDAA